MRAARRKTKVKKANDDWNAKYWEVSPRKIISCPKCKHMMYEETVVQFSMSYDTKAKFSKGKRGKK